MRHGAQSIFIRFSSLLISYHYYSQYPSERQRTVLVYNSFSKVRLGLEISVAKNTAIPYIYKHR